MNKKILIMILSMFMISMAFGAVTVNDSTLYYSFDLDDTSGTTMLDLSAHPKYNGTCTNMASNCNLSTGILINSSDFDGNNDYIDSNYQPTGLTAFTVNFWMYATANTGSTEVMIGSTQAATNRIYVAAATSGRIQFSTINSGGGTVTLNTANNAYTLNAWNMITAVYTGSNIQIYVNNASAGSSAQTGTFNIGHDFAVGAYNNNGVIANYFDGKIDELGFYDRALNATERAELYNDGAAFNPFAPPVIPYALTSNLTNGTYFRTENVSIEVNSSLQSDAMFYYLNNTNYIVEDGLVSYYPFDGDYTDAAGSNDGTNSGTVLVNDSTRLDYLTMAEFDGTSSEITIPDFLTSPSSVTLTAWVNPDDLTGNVFEAITFQNFNYRMYIDDDENDLQCLFIDGSGSGKQLDTNQVITAGNWQHTSCLWNGTHLKAYYNGNEVGTPIVMNSIREETSLFYLGSINTAHFFDGLMDEVRIYNRGLIATEIETLYNESPYTKMCENCNTTTANLTNLAEGSYNISFLGIAEAEVAKLNQNFNIDFTNPVINNTLPLEINTYLLNISQYVTCTDPMSLKYCNITFTPDGNTVAVNQTALYNFTFNGNQSYTIVAEDLAGNSINESGVILVNPIALFKFNNSGTLLTNFTFGGTLFAGDTANFTLYNSALTVGINNTLTFSKVGFLTQTFTQEVLNNSRINTTFNVSEAQINIVIKDKISLTQISGTLFNLEFVGTTGFNTTTSDGNASVTGLLAAGDYRLIVSSTPYQTESVFFTFTNQQILNLTVYVTNQTGFVTINVIDLNGQPIEAVLAQALQWDGSTSSYIEVSEQQTGTDGKANLNIILDDKVYQFKATKNGNSVTTVDQIITTAEDGKVITLTLDIEDITEERFVLQDITYTVREDFNETTNISVVTFSWDTVDGTDVTGCVNAYRIQSGKEVQIGSDNCTTSDSTIKVTSFNITSPYTVVVKAEFDVDGVKYVAGQFIHHPRTNLWTQLRLYSLHFFILPFLYILSISVGLTLQNVYIGTLGLIISSLVAIIMIPTIMSGSIAVFCSFVGVLILVGGSRT